ncbi:MAG: PDZ domain-containing protein [bacterium]|nr:PDZ domain-containing protein [bacterium]
MQLPKPLQYALVASFAAFAGGAGKAVFENEALEGPARLSEVFAETSRRASASVVQVSILQSRGGSLVPAGQGSGVVLSADGLIATNNHVVEVADRVRITFSDGREMPAYVVGTDPDTDLAVVRVNAQELVPAKLRREPAKIGEWVLALGNPFGLGHTVTAGIISGEGRDNLGIAVFENFLQTDAAINPGNSGGPLIDLEGRVVGINTAIAPTSMGQGIGFAIPAEMVRKVTEQLIENGGSVRRGWLGVHMAELTDAGARSVGYDGPGRVAVRKVEPRSPAARAGLEPGDLILRVRRVAVRTSRELLNVIAETEPGTRVDVDIWRDGKLLQVPVTLSKR